MDKENLLSGLTDEEDSLPCIHVTGAGEAWRLSIFLSWQFLFALIHAPSTLLLLCLYMVPSALSLVLVKPNIAIPMALTKFPSKHGLALTLAISLTSLVLCPTWP